MIVENEMAADKCIMRRGRKRTQMQRIIVRMHKNDWPIIDNVYNISK